MPALSKKQQKFMGIVRSIQKGEQPASKFSKDAQDVAKDMKKKDVKKFASTKHKGLPMKKEVLKKLKEMIRQELSEYTYGSGDIVKDVNPTCPHYGAMGKVKSVNPRSVVFVVMNKGKNFKPGMELEKSHDQMKKMNEGSMDWEKKHFPWANKKEQMMIAKLVFQNKDGIDGEVKRQKKNPSSYKNHIKRMVKKGLHESINEMTNSQARDTLNHLGGKRFMVMTGAKPLTIDKKRKELLFKIGRNAKGINLVTIRLTSLDLYDMEFAQVRMGNKKVKAVEKRVYGDQLQKFFKKHTGMNTYL